MLFLQALLAGISIAAIVGPISLYFINKTLQDGIRSAIAIGLGTSLADGLYGFIAALGLSAISSFLSENNDIFQFLGGLFLLYIAYNEIKNDQSKTFIPVKSSRNLMVKIFFLTLASPITIASFIGVFTSIGGGDITINEAVVMALGCFLGSILWWIILGGILLGTKNKLSSKALKNIKISSSIIIGIFGLLAIMSSII